MKPRQLLTVMLVGALVQVAQSVHAQDEQTTRMKTLLAAPARPAESKTHDTERKPIETIQFMGIKTGSTVVDMIAAGGWFTEVLSAAVGPNGKVYSSNPAFMVKEPDESTLLKRLGNAIAVHGPLSESPVFGKADAILTAQNLHDIYNGFPGQPSGEAAAVGFLKPLYDALKPGGVLAVIDHVGIAGQDNVKLHRMLPQQARDALIKAGFTIEAESSLLANAADDHTKGVIDPSIRGKTDQFMIRARKPR